jgi:hypothetical protein
LGLLSVFETPGDTQAAEGLLVVLTYFGLACAHAALASEFGLPDALVLACVGFTMLAGWMLSVVQADNYDYAAALVYFSGLAAMIRDPAPFTRRRWAWLGFLCAALYYTYPELVIAILGCTVLFLIERLLHAEDRFHVRRGLLTGALAAVVIWLALTAPYLKESSRYFTQQAAGTLTATVRPGEGYFPGLLLANQIVPAVWALGGEFVTPQRLAVRLLRLLIGLGLFVLLVRGLLELLRRRAWSVVLVMLALTAGTLLMIVRYAYSYGAYKFIVFNWGLMILAVVLGASAWTRTSVRRAAMGVSLLMLLAIPAVLAVRLSRVEPTIASQSLEWFRPVAHVRDLVGHEPLGIALENDLSSYWAIYFLRDQHIQLLQFPTYLGMPHVQPLMARAPVIAPASIRYLLTDTVDPGPLVEVEGWARVWRQGRYTLWDTAANGWAVAQTVSTPNGVERVNDHAFLWLGGGSMSVAITASRAGAARLAGRFIVGPNLPADTSSLHLRVGGTSGVDREVTIAPGPGAVCLPLSPGTTTWTLTPLDRAEPSRQPSSDPRPRLIGLEAPTLQWAPTAAATGSADGC